ncbi:hypothetical protein GOP47_0000454, partial [Adiantum capillus-veneris]
MAFDGKIRPIDSSKVLIKTCSEVQLHEPIKASCKVQHNERLDFGRGFSLQGSCPEALQLLQQLEEAGLLPNIRTWNAILAGYSQQGYDKEASQLFQQISHEGLEASIVTWNTLISGLVLHGHSQEALNMYLRMMYEGGKPDKATFMPILKACADVTNLKLWKTNPRA